MRCSTLVSVLVGLCLVVGSVVCQTDSFSETFGFKGGLPFCSQCAGNGEYQCSDRPGYNGTFLVRDKTPVNAVVTNISITLYGSYDCSSLAVMDFAPRMNGQILSATSLTSTAQHCQCSTCDGNVTVNASRYYGFGNYKYGDSNVFSLDIFPLESVFCLNSVTIKISYSMSAFKLSALSLPISMNLTSSVPTCGASGYQLATSSGPFLINVKNPLPEGSTLVSISVTVFGRYFYSVGNCLTSSTLKLTFGSTNLGQITVTRNQTSPPLYTPFCSSVSVPGCNGPVTISDPTLWQNGIPGYKYDPMQVNTFAVTPTYYLSVGAMTLDLYYYTLQSKSAFHDFLSSRT